MELERLVADASKISLAFSTSYEYLEYIALRDTIRQNPQHVEMINSYKHSLIAVESDIAKNVEVSLQRQKEVSDKETKLNLNKDCKRFLELEKYLLTYLNEINKALYRKIDISIEL